MADVAKKRILVVEDEFMLALELAHLLTQSDAVVVGPVASIPGALQEIEEGPLDLAVLDLNLAGHVSVPVAEALATRGIPFVFTTGYLASAVPDRFRNVPLCSKPVEFDLLKKTLKRVLENSSRRPGAR